MRTQFHDTEWYRARYIEKYGPGFLTDMERLKVDYSYTLQMAGAKYGVTREAIRKQFNRFWGVKYTAYTKEKSAKYHSAVQETGCANDPRHKVAEYAPGATLEGAKSELAVANKCRELGYTVESPCGTNVDLSVNGFKVEVKRASKSVQPDKKGTSRYFHFHTNLRQTSEADFYVCEAVANNAFYILPSAVVSADHFFIRDSKTPYSGSYKPKRVDYEQFRDAWGLLTAKPSQEIPTLPPEGGSPRQEYFRAYYLKKKQLNQQ